MVLEKKIIPLKLNLKKEILKKKFKIVAQNNAEEIVWIQLEDNKQIIPLTFTVMIHLLRN
jgi:hypothetical protein